MKALIFGAGPAGLVTALRLKQALGIEPVVYEIRSEPTTLGGAVQLPPNGLRLIEQLGLSKAILARGFSSGRLQLHSMQGRVLADWDRTDGTRKAPDHGFLRILRNDLLHVLLEAVQDHGIVIHYSKSLTRVDETDADVIVTFSDGSTDSGDILLGCDGIHSAVRSLLIDPDAKPEYSGVANMFGLLPVSAQELGIDPALHATITPHGLVAVSPYTETADHLYWFFSRSVPIPESGSRDGWEAVSKHEVDGFKGTLLDILADATGEWNDKLRKIICDTDRVKFYPIYKMPPNCKWSSKRSLLLGDAAHAMQPHIGQGTSMALEDAFYLSRVLEEPGRSLTEALQIYEAVRRPRVERIAQASADRGGDTRQASGPAWHRLKEIGIGLGFWFYKTARLDRMGVGMDKEAVEYDIMQEPIPRIL
jgi:2-polyprenyl-6-methoxyphenol hydroxylase-like FAD-dependent oxidoreductase